MNFSKEHISPTRDHSAALDAIGAAIARIMSPGAGEASLPAPGGTRREIHLRQPRWPSNAPMKPTPTLS